MRARNARHGLEVGAFQLELQHDVEAEVIAVEGEGALEVGDFERDVGHAGETVGLQREAMGRHGAQGTTGGASSGKGVAPRERPPCRPSAGYVCYLASGFGRN